MALLINYLYMKNLIEKIKSILTQRYHKHYKKRMLVLVVDIFLIIAISVIIAAIGYFLFSRYDNKMYFNPEWDPSSLKNRYNQTGNNAKYIPKLEVVVSATKDTVRAGEVISFSLKLKNNEISPINNFRLSFLSGNNKFRVASVESARDGKLTTDKNGLFVIEPLAVAEERELKINIRFDRKEPSLNQAVNLLAIVNYNIGEVAYKKIGSSRQMKVLSNFEVVSAAYYYSSQGDQLGAGPLPPSIGLPTSYWVVWDLENYGNDLTGVTMSAIIPANVVWLDNKNLLSGNLQYLEAERKVIWNIGRINKEGGGNKARFEIAIIPEDKDFGKVLNLSTDVNLALKDEFCDQVINKRLNNITTELQLDRLAAGKGRVVR